MFILADLYKYIYFFLNRFENSFRSTTSIPATLDVVNHHTNNCDGPDSPRSTRSAPWARSQQRGLFGITASPRSVRSATTRDSHVPIHCHRHRSSSVESHSSTESKSGKRLIYKYIFFYLKNI